MTELPAFRTCSICRIEKSISHFFKTSWYCRPCNAERNKAPRVRDLKRKWREENAEFLKEKERGRLRKPRPKLTEVASSYYQELATLLDYNPETGSLTWKVQRSNRMPGDKAGVVRNSGYAYVGFHSKRFLVHRIAWLMHYGELPTKLIDHRNHDRLDNRICNLRLADPVQNGRNRRKPKNNTSGYKGVVRAGKKWTARIRYNGRVNSLGIFESPEAAHEAYVQAAHIHHGEFACP